MPSAQSIRPVGTRAMTAFCWARIHERLTAWVRRTASCAKWARRGTRPRQPADQRYESTYLFGAICPARAVGAALALPSADTEAMQLHLEEISANVAVGAHAMRLLDRVGGHITPSLVMPKNITPVWLPSRAPEFNPVENIWQYLPANWAL
jgi:hypothetical protein